MSKGVRMHRAGGGEGWGCACCRVVSQARRCERGGRSTWPAQGWWGWRRLTYERSKEKGEGLSKEAGLLQVKGRRPMPGKSEGVGTCHVKCKGKRSGSREEWGREQVCHGGLKGGHRNLMSKGVEGHRK